MTGSTYHAVHAMVANANELTTYQVSANQGGRVCPSTAT